MTGDGFGGLHEELGLLSGRRLLAVSGIGNPEAFLITLQRAGLMPLRSVVRADHHSYTKDDIQQICGVAQSTGAEAVITTEKDLIKLRRLGWSGPLPLWALQIAVDFAADGGKMLQEQVLACVARRSAAHPVQQ